MSSLKSEPRELFYLRHRWSQVMCAWTNFYALCNKEIFVGENCVIKSDEVLDELVKNQRTTCYSYLASLFDNRSRYDMPVNFINITERLELDKKTELLRKRVIGVWGVLKEELKQIRNKVGFHQDTDDSKVKDTYNKLDNETLSLVDALIIYLKHFFDSLDNLYEQSNPSIPLGAIKKLLPLQYSVITIDPMHKVKNKGYSI
ncbi:hypothetical protein [Bacillus sp. D48C]